MVQRTTVPIDNERRILLTTERLADDSWAVVATILESTPNGERVVDLPVIDQRFPAQIEAEAFGEEQARAWMRENLPEAA